MRPIVCVENPIMDPVEVTKLVAAKWYSYFLFVSLCFEIIFSFGGLH